MSAGIAAEFTADVAAELKTSKCLISSWSLVKKNRNKKI